MQCACWRLLRARTCPTHTVATFEPSECWGVRLWPRIALRGNASAMCGCVNIRIFSKEAPLYGWGARPLLLGRHWLGRNWVGFEEKACKGGGCGWSSGTPRGLTAFGFQTGSPCPTHPLLHKRHKKHTHNGGGISNLPLPSHPHPLLHVR